MTKRSQADSKSFEAGGKRYTVRFVPSAWIELEDAGLGNVQKVIEVLENDPSFKNFVMIFAAALRGGMKDKEITDETALEVADELGSGSLLEMLTDLIQSSFPEHMQQAGNVKKPGSAKK